MKTPKSNITGKITNTEAYKSLQEFIDDIKRVFESDYGRTLSDIEATEIANSFDLLLYNSL